MQNKNAGFALPLSKTSRLLGALEITAVKNGIKGNWPLTLLLALMEEDGELTYEQRKTHAMYNIGEEKRKYLREFFSKVYADEEAICYYLNRKISINYFKKQKRKGETIVDVSIRNILESSIGIDMLI